MNNVIEVNNLSKSFDLFSLKKLSFVVPAGRIVGFIGENGAGKSTTIKLILNILRKDSGQINIFGNANNNIDIRNDIGVVFDDCITHDSLYAKDLCNVFRKIYKNWDDSLFYSLLQKFDLPKNIKIRKLSRGMKAKLSIICAFSHHPKLLILDEVTAGLDPTMRSELLDMLLEFIQDENHSIFFSSHITSDIEKIADYVLLIHKGEKVFFETKENLLCNYGIARCYKDQFSGINKDEILAFEETTHSINCLIKNKERFHKDYSNITVDSASLEEIMLFFVKGEQK